MNNTDNYIEIIKSSQSQQSVHSNFLSDSKNKRNLAVTSPRKKQDGTPFKMTDVASLKKSKDTSKSPMVNT